MSRKRQQDNLYSTIEGTNTAYPKETVFVKIACKNARSVSRSKSWLRHDCNMSHRAIPRPIDPRYSIQIVAVIPS